MQSSKEKLKNVASAAKEQVDIYKAKIDEKAEKATARTKEEKVIAEERAKAKEAKAKMELHEAKARHAAEKLSTNQSHNYGLHDHEPHLDGAHQYQGHQPLGTVPKPGATHPTYPLGGNPPRNTHI
ncbi:late embryogenesis abundant protein 6-like [Gastrolobium bilobum]|uniref:late embryogenesis abundant protein 6-like n=1 Tax=Gastrolobium bilobum TaxID=150636 RepID=UPI002AB1E32E|nr:late embryogenesis abundant protein 6-like [Gastrolobium bilobum]